eukprot:282967_1
MELDSLLGRSNKNGLLSRCIGFISIAFIFFLNMSAFIIACVDIDIKCNDNLNYHASSALISGVIFTVVCAIIDGVFGLCVKKDNNTCLAIVNIVYFCIVFIISCYGLTVYSDMDVDCKMTSLGSVLLAWSLIYFFIDVFLCCCGCCLFLRNAISST